MGKQSQSAGIERRKSQIFLSYSRCDQEVVKALVDELEATGRLTVWIDREDIYAGDKFWPQISEAIEASDALLFIISPDSAESRHCRREVDIAGRNKKRIVPVVHREVPAESLPPAVASRQWFFLPESSETALADLIQAIERDLDWVHMHSELQRRALLRQRKREEDSSSATAMSRRRKVDSYLLRGEELEIAEHWLQTAEGREPEPTPLHVELVTASRLAAVASLRRRLVWVSVALMVSIILGAIAFNRYLAAESRRLAALSQLSLERDRERSQRLALEAVDKMVTPEAEDALRRALGDWAARLALGGHRGGVRTAAFSPLGDTVASFGSRSGNVKLWDPQSGALLVTLHGHLQGPTDLTFSPDGSLLATAGMDRKVKLWDVAARSLRLEVSSESEIVDLAWSPDGESLAGAGQVPATIWDVQSGQPLKQLGEQFVVIERPSYRPLVAWRPDGERLATAGTASTVVIWRWREESRETVISIDDVRALSTLLFSPDGEHLITAGEYGATVWNSKTGERLRAFGNRPFSSLAYSPDGTKLVSSTITLRDDELDRLTVWDARSGEELLSLEDPEVGRLTASQGPPGQLTVALGAEPVNGVATWDARSGELLLAFEDPEVGLISASFGPLGQLILADGPRDAISLWDAESGKLVRVLGYEEPITAVNWIDLSFEGLLLTARGAPFGPRGEINPGRPVLEIWDVERKELLCAWNGRPYGVTTAVFDPGGRRVVTAGWDHVFEVWEYSSCPPRSLESVEARQDPSTEYWPQAAYSSDGRRIAATRDSDVVLFDGTNFETQGSLPVAGVRSLAFSPDASRLATVDHSGKLLVWSMAAPEAPLTQFGDGTYTSSSLAFSPDGIQIVTADSDAKARVWDLREGQMLHALVGHQWGVRTVLFTADGEYVLTGGGDATIKVWDAASGRLQRTLYGNGHWVNHIALSKDQRWVMSADMDGVVSVQPLHLSDLLELALRRVGG